MIIGTDLGYSYTKDCYGGIFRSCMQDGKSDLSGGIEVNIDGCDYSVGVGSGVMDTDKIDHALTKVLLLTDLYLSGDTHYDVVTGLPIAQYRSGKQKLKDMIIRLDGSIVNGERIRIRNCEIFPQCAAALYSAEIEDNCIIVDIGGRTVDIGLFEYTNGNHNLIDCNTLYSGMESVYSDVVKLVNERYSLSLNRQQGERIVRYGLTVDGVEQSLSFLKPTLQKYANTIIEELELHYPARTTPVYMCGGGAEVFGEYISRHLPSATVIENSQFANADGYYVIAKSLFGG